MALAEEETIFLNLLLQPSKKGSEFAGIEDGATYYLHVGATTRSRLRSLMSDLVGRGEEISAQMILHVCLFAQDKAFIPILELIAARGSTGNDSFAARSADDMLTKQVSSWSADPPRASWVGPSFSSAFMHKPVDLEGLLKGNWNQRDPRDFL